MAGMDAMKDQLLLLMLENANICYFFQQKLANT